MTSIPYYWPRKQTNSYCKKIYSRKKKNEEKRRLLPISAIYGHLFRRVILQWLYIFHQQPQLHFLLKGAALTLHVLNQNKNWEHLKNCKLRFASFQVRPPHPAGRAFLLLAQFWRTWKSLCRNWIIYLPSMRCTLLGHSFELRLNSRALGIPRSVMTSGLSINECSNQFDERKQDWPVQKLGRRRLQKLDGIQAEPPFLHLYEEEHKRKLCSQGASVHTSFYICCVIHTFF